MSNTFTAQELADFYQKVADGSEVEYLGAKRLWQRNLMGPDMHTEKRLWRIKPTQKVIDLSVLIESGIDCEFTDNCWQVYSYIDILTDIECTAAHPYTTDDVDLSYNKCRPRMNHIHAWQGGECPLPEGFRVKAWLRDGGEKPIETLVNYLTWSHGNVTSRDIIAFEVLGLADEYVMPWEQDNG